MRHIYRPRRGTNRFHAGWATTTLLLLLGGFWYLHVFRSSHTPRSVVRLILAYMLERGPRRMPANTDGGGLGQSVPTVTGRKPRYEKWLMGYYAEWQQRMYPIQRIDFTAITHIALVHWMTAADGKLRPSGMDALAPNIISLAHQNGRKAVMMLGGSDDANFASAADPANRPVLVDYILKKKDSLSLDGVDLDWEVNINSANFIALARALREARPDLVITVPLDPTQGSSSQLAAGLAPYCDQVNMMTYGGGGNYPGWVSWYFSPIGGDDWDHPSSLNRFVNKWLKAGVPSRKIGVGIGLFAKGWTAPVTGPLQFIGSASVPIDQLPYAASGTDGGSVLSWFYNQPGSTYIYDAGPAQQPSIRIPNGLTPGGWTGAPITWVTYEDEASIAAKAEYVESNNLGGAIIWTLNEGVTDPVVGRNPQLDAAKLTFLGKGAAPMPLVASRETYTHGEATLTVNLPINLTLIAVVWRGGGGSFDENIYSDTSYGRPSEYYIEGSADGLKWMSLTHVTNNSYNARQFVFDIAGNGFTRLRMRVKSLVGTHDGKLVLEVHDAHGGSADSYLFLGDSVACDCWGAADFPREAFGPGIHVHRSAQYPMFSNGGIPGLVSDSLLSTTKYGIPIVRQWLKDFSATKYVVLSYGVDDANQNVSPATYCTNMEALTQEVIAAGKTPIVPRILAAPSANVELNAPHLNACLSQLKNRYPSIISGPDLWSVFYGHTTKDGWFRDELHLSMSSGCAAWKKAWINNLLPALYPQ